MAKEGLELNKLTNILKDKTRTSGWALCIGAGTSVPAFPNWGILVERLAAHDVGYPDAIALIADLANYFSYDALIQAANDRLGLDAKDFANLLINELYKDIKDKLTSSEWRFFTRVLSSMRVGNFKPQEWNKFLDIIRRYFGHISALPIAEVIAEVYETNLAPDAILSFNAEPLLVALINAFVSKRIAPSLSPISKRGELKAVTDIVTHGISNRRANRIPYYFCHGLLPVPVSPARNQATQSLDKLVFSEATYLQLSNTSFSWQSSVFIDVCSSKSVLFIGVSLSDSNMRRWLSWIHANRIQELRERNAYRGVSTSHYWINKSPISDQERLWIESSVAHLGVRLIWINDWNEIGQALRLMLGK